MEKGHDVTHDAYDKVYHSAIEHHISCFHHCRSHKENDMLGTGPENAAYAPVNDILYNIYIYIYTMCVYMSERRTHKIFRI